MLVTKFRSRLQSILCLFFLFPLLSLAHSSALLGQPNTLAKIVKRVTPAVVSITVEHKPSDEDVFADNEGAQPKPNELKKLFSIGSGVIVDAKKGLIVTNAHVIDHAKLIVVTLKDGRKLHAKLVGKSDPYDIAVIKIHANDLHAIVFGNSSALQVGDFVVAIGSPFGLTESVTSGVVSSLNRNQPQVEGFQSFIQTDAPINPGNSGGALVNLTGELVGINTAILSPTDTNNGIGFAIPSNMAHAVVEQLIKYGKVKHGVLGIIIQDLTAELANAMNITKTHQGALISEVLPDSPGDKAGLAVGDVVTKLNDTNIISNVQLRNLLGLKHPGTQVKLTVLRHNEPQLITATIGDPKTLKQRIVPFLEGMQLRSFSQLEPDSRYVKGVLVTGVSDTSDGTLAGIAPGDIITNANGQPVPNLDALEKMALSGPQQLLVTVVRDNRNLFLVINPS